MKNARFLSSLVATVATLSLLAPSFASAERLNKTIETLAAGQAAFGIFSGDRSLSNARSLSRSELDYILIDMEHGPYDVETLQTFLLGMTNKAEIKATNSLAMNTTPIVRLPTNGREMNQYLVKQVLDMGVFGVMFPMINTREEAENAIASMRFPRAAGETDHGPQGLRGRSPGTAVWYWGTGYSEYLSKADVWPLDPQGELLAVIQIETQEAIGNLEAIVTTPGVGAIFIGPSDLSADIGLPRSHPTVEAAIQTILASCIKHNVPCGITTSPNDIAERTKQGFRFATVGGDSGISPRTERALNIGRETAGRD